MDIINKSAEEIINISCKELKLLSNNDKWIVAKKVSSYYKDKGFPYYQLSQEEKIKCIDKLYHFDIRTLELENNELQQNMLGLNFVNSYHPKMWEVLCGNSKKSPMDVFLDDDLFTKAIVKRINLSDTKLQPFNIRKSLRIFGGYSVSNFRPTIAKYIYRKYCPKNGIVLDPCMGYGGRLFAALVSGIKYVGIDPDINQVGGNYSLAKDVINILGKDKVNIPELYLSAFEDFNSRTRRCNLVFTSPPYFDKEKYSFNDNQSFIRYPIYEKWRDNFLRVLINKSFHALEWGGYFIINIAGDNLVHDTIRFGSEIFSSEPEIKWMRLSKLLGKKVDKNKDKFKLEGIYIWKKK